VEAWRKRERENGPVELSHHDVELLILAVEDHGRYRKQGLTSMYDFTIPRASLSEIEREESGLGLISNDSADNAPSTEDLPFFQLYAFRTVYHIFQAN